jgi:tRNA pseudouridine55 synthase
MTAPDPSLPASPSGLLIIEKPEGVSSMGVCRKVRGSLVAGGAPKRIKVGHGGTLDPLATGVLVVLIGKATPLCDRVMAGEKEYLAEVDLSQFSTTDDREGERTLVSVAHPPSLETLRAACDLFLGVIPQRPPAYSAIKVQGRRAYDLARKGDAPVLPARPVVIHEIAITRYQWPIAALHIRCGKGVYIRSLARDLGAALSTGGMLQALCRTRVARCTIDRAIPLAAIPQPLRAEHLLDPAAFL